MNEKKIALIVLIIAIIMITITYFTIQYFTYDVSKTQTENRQWVHRERIESVNLGPGVYGNITVALVFNNYELHKKAVSQRAQIKESILLSISEAVSSNSQNISYKEIVEKIKTSPFIVNELNKPDIYIEEFVSSRSS